MIAANSKQRTLLSLTPLLARSNQPTVISETDQPVRVTALRHPFRTERVSVELPAGGSIADMVRAVGLSPEIPLRIMLNDRIILANEYMRVFPKPGQILSIRAIPAGGGSSKDSEILTIAIAAVAAAAGALVGNPEVGLLATNASLFESGGFLAYDTLQGIVALSAIQGAISTSVNFLGGLATNALTSTPPTPAPKAVSTPQSYTVSGTANGAAPFSPVPEIYGDAQNCFYEPRARPDSRCIVAAAIGRASILQHPSEGGRLSVSVDGVFLRVYPRNACRQFFTSGRRAFGRKLNSWIPVARDGPLPQRETISGAGRLTHATPRHQAIRPLPLQSSLRDGSTSRERDKRCYGDESTYLNSHA